MMLKATITQHMKEAMRAKDARRLAAIRLLLAAIQQREVDERRELSDADVVGLVERLIRQRRESVAQYEAAGRRDLADNERFEIEVLQGYLPQPLSEGELQALIERAVTDTGAAGPKDMGRVMAALKPQIAGRAEMGRVSALVKARLGAG
ncbi:GatB/YqeY domain-containing protein [Pelomicrobium sp. G1]|uniref:GatB/YqeY domain-containing protein n=1 Tax=unclassified Pelomicrobium TaxID=2815318 RepID=UPI003F76F76B